MPHENEQPQVSDMSKDMIATFSTEQGEKVFSWLLHECRFDSTVGVYDPYKALFWEGRRSVILDMLDIMQDPRLKDRRGAIASREVPVYTVTEAADTDA